MATGQGRLQTFVDPGRTDMSSGEAAQCVHPPLLLKVVQGFCRCDIPTRPASSYIHLATAKLTLAGRVRQKRVFALVLTTRSSSGRASVVVCNSSAHDPAALFIFMNSTPSSAVPATSAPITCHSLPISCLETLRPRQPFTPRTRARRMREVDYVCLTKASCRLVFL